MSLPPNIIYSVKDKNNPNSLVNICPTALAERISCIPDGYLDMTAEKLEQHYNPTKEDKMMRVAFQMELERSTRTQTPFNMVNVCGGFMYPSTFYKSVITNATRLAYIIKPFPEYMIQLEEMMHLANNRIREILARPAVNEEGKFDHKLAALQQVVWEKVTDRARGSVTKKLEVDSRTVNVNMTKTNPIDIDRELKDLEAQLSTREVKAIGHNEKEDSAKEL